MEERSSDEQLGLLTSQEGAGVGGWGVQQPMGGADEQLALLTSQEEDNEELGCSSLWVNQWDTLMGEPGTLLS